MSIGGYQSNHTRQVAAVAAKVGLKAVLVQENWVDWPDALNDRVGNILLSRIMGAEVRLDPAGFGIGFKDSWKQALADVEAAEVRRTPSRPALRTTGSAGSGSRNWAYEVEQQERELGVFFDTIVVCAVTGSTQAGMIAGFAGQDRPRRVIGIDASAKLQETRDQVERIARATAELIELGRDLRDDEITVLEGWAGDLYGIPVQSTLDAIRLTGQLEGMIIDPVYEGKSMAGLIDLIRNGDIPKDSNVLYAHLGGQPALNAYSGLFTHSSADAGSDQGSDEVGEGCGQAAEDQLAEAGVPPGPAGHAGDDRAADEERGQRQDQRRYDAAGAEEVRQQRDERADREADERRRGRDAPGSAGRWGRCRALRGRVPRGPGPGRCGTVSRPCWPGPGRGPWRGRSRRARSPRRSGAA